MDTSLPAAFASHFTAKVAATCSLVSIVVFLVPAAIEGESGLFITPFGVCVVHALLAFVLFVLEHRYSIQSDSPKTGSIVSFAVLYLVNVSTATLPIIVVLYGPRVLINLGTG
ncbi:MAG: hypothetical protein OXU71_02315 [Gammaproteobacteria bacterium]|nr:hypothetical protein [Gammaproteobacteria bacterium]